MENELKWKLVDAFERETKREVEQIDDNGEYLTLYCKDVPYTLAYVFNVYPSLKAAIGKMSDNHVRSFVTREGYVIEEV